MQQTLSPLPGMLPELPALLAAEYAWCRFVWYSMGMLCQIGSACCFMV